MPIIPDHYVRMDWLPCSDCWNEREYELEQYLVDTMGPVHDADGHWVLDPDWEPDLDDPQWGEGVTVERDDAGRRT